MNKRALPDPAEPLHVVGRRVPKLDAPQKVVGATVYAGDLRMSGLLVGAILRSAAAFGVTDVVLGRGCADPWSPKVLRAGMGAHFAVRLEQVDDLAAALTRFGATVYCTVPRGGRSPAAVDLAGRSGWLLGAEGQGVSEVLAARAQTQVTIPMPGPVESLNVAVAAAICFYERARQLRTSAA